MKDIYKETIRAMCDCDMNISKAAKSVWLCRGALINRIQAIKKRYGLDPCVFWDLVKLAQMADRKEEPEEVIKRYCRYCSKELSGKQRKYCSSECTRKHYSKMRYYDRYRYKERL